MSALCLQRRNSSGINMNDPAKITLPNLLRISEVMFSALMVSNENSDGTKDSCKWEGHIEHERRLFPSHPLMTTGHSLAWMGRSTPLPPIFSQISSAYSSWASTYFRISWSTDSTDASSSGLRTLGDFTAICIPSDTKSLLRETILG